MKKFFFSLIVLTLAVACGQDKFVVKGTLAEGATFPENALVCLYDGDTVLDSAAVVDGTFQLKAPANPEKFYRIAAKYDRAPRDFAWSFGVIPEKGTFPVTFAPKASECAIENSALNKAFNDFNVHIRDLFDEYRQKILPLGNSASEEAEQLYDQTMEKVKTFCLETVGKNADNYIGKNALQNIIYDLPLDELKSVLAKCGKFIRDDESIARILSCKEAEIATAEGQPFIDFAGKTPEGADVKLSDYVGKGKWVLTDFWASWCGPCMREIPNIKRVFETYEGDDFMVLGVAVWDADDEGTNKKSQAQMEKMDMQWHQIFVGDDKGPTDAYGILGIPTMILFAPDGTIYKRGEELRGESMMTSVAEALGK